MDNINQVIRQVFGDAETSVRESIRILGHCSEEEITFLLRLKLTEQVEYRNNDNSFAEAFAQDFSFRNRRYSSKVLRALDGLVGHVSWHDRTAEGKNPRSGGDFGIVVYQPEMNSRNGIKFKRQGLLVQAKSKAVGSKHFGSGLTDTQVDVYESRRPYYVILGFKYAAEKSLESFQWLDCRGSTLAKLESLLKKGSIPSAMSTDCLIDKLTTNKIGTSCDKEISEIISVARCPILEIRIDWPDGSKPDVSRILQRESSRERIQVRLHN